MSFPRSTYYYKPRAETDLEKVAGAELRDRIEKICFQWPHYGYRRVTAELKHQGHVVNHKRVARVMKEEALQCQIKRKYLRPKNKKTGRDRFYAAPNLIRGMRVSAPNQVWVADLTYIRLEQGFVFLAVVLDVYSRRVVGWALSESMQVELTLTALRMAILSRRPKPGCIHHSDRGSQYACEKYVSALEMAKLKISMSKPGYPYDNAFVESFMKTLKQEEVDCTEYKNLDDLRGRVPYFIEKIYNEQRLHSKIGYISPANFEKKLPRTRARQYITIA